MLVVLVIQYCSCRTWQVTSWSHDVHRQLFVFCSVLAWLAAVVALNENRTGPRYEAAAISKETVSDGMHLQCPHSPRAVVALSPCGYCSIF